MLERCRIKRSAACQRTLADSLYWRLTPYNITSAPSIASLIASIVDPFMFVTAQKHVCPPGDNFSERHML